MATKRNNKALPQVVLENKVYRIVAKERTGQAPSSHALHMVVDLNDDGENRDCVDLYAEVKHADSLGSASWSSCSFIEAKDDIIASLVREGLDDKPSKINKP